MRIEGHKARRLLSQLRNFKYKIFKNKYFMINIIIICGFTILFFFSLSVVRKNIYVIYTLMGKIVWARDFFFFFRISVRCYWVRYCITVDEDKHNPEEVGGLYLKHIYGQTSRV